MLEKPFYESTQQSFQQLSEQIDLYLNQDQEEAQKKQNLTEFLSEVGIKYDQEI